MRTAFHGRRHLVGKFCRSDACVHDVDFIECRGF
jgi:hypothetical protein